MLGAALVNVALNAGIAWLSVRGQRTVPLWPARVVGGPSTFTDTVGTLFVLPLTTCLMCTTAVWRELRDGGLSPLARPAGVLGCALARLPARRLRRGLVLGALTTLALGPPVTLLLVVLHVGELSGQAFMVYKVGFAVALGALVTPLIVVRAMVDDPRAPA